MTKKVHLSEQAVKMLHSFDREWEDAPYHSEALKYYKKMAEHTFKQRKLSGLGK